MTMRVMYSFSRGIMSINNFLKVNFNSEFLTVVYLANGSLVLISRKHRATSSLFEPHNEYVGDKSEYQWSG